MTFSELTGPAEEILRQYEYPKAAMLPLLWLVQQKQGYVSQEAEVWVGRQLGVGPFPRTRGGHLLQHVPHRTGGTA